MKSTVAFVGAMAAFWPALSLAQPAPAAQRPVIHSIVFRCHVAEGPKLTACEAIDAPSLEPIVLENLRLTVEGYPPCMLPALQVGSVIDRPLSYADGPWLHAPPQPSHHVVTNPDWAERPTPEMAARYYPVQARAAHALGHATLNCLVNADGTTRDCKVIEETPANLGFGDAALGMSREFRMKPQTRDCKPTNDGKINVPVSFPPL